jgi:hypothetical protein
MIVLIYSRTIIFLLIYTYYCYSGFIIENRTDTCCYGFTINNKLLIYPRTVYSRPIQIEKRNNNNNNKNKYIGMNKDLHNFIEKCIDIQFILFFTNQYNKQKQNDAISTSFVVL